MFVPLCLCLCFHARADCELSQACGFLCVTASEESACHWGVTGETWRREGFGGVRGAWAHGIAVWDLSQSGWFVR